MKRLKVIADDKIPFLKGVLEPYADIVYLPGAKITAHDVKDADAIFTRTRTKCNESLLKNSRVKLIATATIGYDHIDTDYCKEAGIRWVNAPGCNSWSVQQYLTAAIVTFIYKRKLKLSELTLGIIGVGNVGSKVAQAAKALGMRVLLNDPPRAAALRMNGQVAYSQTNASESMQSPPPASNSLFSPVNEGAISDRQTKETFISLEQLLAESDIVTCHTPLTKDGPWPTYHLAADNFFNQMKKEAVFINTSRGPVTDNEALKRAAKTKLSDYILDVWESEPHPEASLLADAFIGTPHIAGYSADGKANGTAACVHEFCSFFNPNSPHPFPGYEQLKDWYPEAIPPPPVPTTFVLDGAGKNIEQIMYEAVTHTYPIMEDSERLKNAPETFEEQRGGYWIRREFKNFTIQPTNINDNMLDALKNIGFKINNAPA